MAAVDLAGRDAFFELCALEITGRECWIVESSVDGDVTGCDAPVAATLHCVVVWVSETYTSHWVILVFVDLLLLSSQMSSVVCGWCHRQR